MANKFVVQKKNKSSAIVRQMKITFTRGCHWLRSLTSFYLASDERTLCELSNVDIKSSRRLFVTHLQIFLFFCSFFDGA
jgi:hypothetical protein